MVSISLVSIGVSNVPGISVLRLMRAFRVLRLFARLASLRQIINALTEAIMPVTITLFESLPLSRFVCMIVHFPAGMQCLPYHVSGGVHLRSVVM